MKWISQHKEGGEGGVREIEGRIRSRDRNRSRENEEQEGE